MIRKFTVQTIPVPSLPVSVQEAINRITGLNPHGEPIVRLEWGGIEVKQIPYGEAPKYPRPSTTPEEVFNGWDEVHQNGKRFFHPASVKVPDVSVKSLLVARWELRSQADPCWYLAEWVPGSRFGSPEQWNDHRYQADATGVMLDLLGPYPSRGRYEGLMRLVTTEGDLLQPDDSRVLELVRRYWALAQNVEMRRHWLEEMPESEKRQGMREMLATMEEEQRQKIQAFREGIRDRVKTYKHLLAHNPRVFVHQD